MSKLIAVITAGLFAAGTILAADPNKCAQHVVACKDLVAKFNREANNKRLFNQVLDNYQKNGCTPEGYEALMSFAQVALKTRPEPKQAETFKAECRQGVNQPPGDLERLRRFAQQLQKAGAIALVMKNCLATVASCAEVLDGILNSTRSGRAIPPA